VTTTERFWAKVQKSNGCWRWTGAHSDTGYGIFMLSGTKPKRKAVLAHRHMWEIQRGPIPAGLTIDHLCRNRECVNPSHMEVVTQKENNRRASGISTIHAAKPKCPKCGGEYARMGTGERRCIPCRLARRRERYAMGFRNV
jgi:hypothetical protein